MEEINYMKLTLGEKITMLRKQEGKTLEEVAEHLGMNLTVYIRLENDFTYPTDKQIARIGELYNLTYEEVLAVGEG